MVEVVAATHVKPERDPVPPGVDTLTLPDAPVRPGTAVIVVELTTVYEAAAVPPKVTPETLLKLVPVIVTSVTSPTPVVGVNEVMVGAGTQVKPLKVAVPSGVVTLTDPDDPAPTTAVMVVEFTTLNEVAAVPPKLTAVAPVKFVPVMVTVNPFPEIVGVNELMDKRTV